MPMIQTDYAERADDMRYAPGEGEVGSYIHYGRREKMVKNVKAAVSRADELFAAAEKEEDLLLRRGLMQRLYLYASSWQIVGPQTHAAGEKALGAIAEIDRQLSLKRLEAEPRLKTRLEALVIREKLLTDALAEVAAVAGVKLDLMPGAIAAAGRLQGRRTLEVTFMDLRGATAAQAFEWLCAPVHLSWSASAGKVRVTIAALSGEAAPWTYDVSALALPLTAELKGAKKWNEKNKLANSLADEFMAAVRKAAGAEAPEDCFWLGSGQIVVHGKAAAHGAVNRLLSELKAGSGDHGELGKRVQERYKARKESLEKALEAREKAEVYGALYWSSWTLLAAAADGESDLEALTRLQAAWKDRFAAKLAAADEPVTAVRSAWAVSESAAVRSKDAELKELAKELLARIGPSADKALATLKASSEKGTASPGAYLAVIYSVLAFRNGNTLGVVDDKRLASFEKEAVALMFHEAAKEQKGAVDHLRTMARVLVLGADKADGGELAKLFEAGMGGDDLNALCALTARKKGGNTWLAFRTAAAANFSRMGVSGSVVLIANRLSKNALPSAR
jgi:hypothetical protein